MHARSVVAAGLAFGIIAAVVPTVHAQTAIYVFDQTGDRLVRLIDNNHDGDYHDPDETNIYYDDTPGPLLGIDNSQGMVVLGFDHMLATDNFEPDNILELEDLNGDGDALDPGEARVVFNGALPGGFTMQNPADLIRMNPNYGDGFILHDNNTLGDSSNPEAYYDMVDLNSDGDFDDPGELVRLITLSPPGDCCASTFLSVAQDDSGFLYGIDIATPDDDPGNVESIDRIDPLNGTRNEYISNSATFANVGLFLNGGFEVEHLPSSDEIIAELVDFGFNGSLFAFKDLDNSGTINGFDEARLLWSEAANADGVTGGTMRDIHVAPDESVYTIDNVTKRIRRHEDLNGDGDYQDAGETTIVYDADTAALNNEIELVQPLTIVVAIADEPCLADINGDGVLTGADFNAFLGAFNDGDPRADQNGDGQLTGADFNAWLGNFNDGCA